MASENPISSSAPAATGLKVLYDARRKRIPVMKACNKKIDIDATYVDIFALPASLGVYQPCLICATTAAYVGEKPIELSTPNTAAKVSHVACVHPFELVEVQTSLEYVVKLLKPAGGAKKSGAAAATGSMDTYVSKKRVPAVRARDGAVGAQRVANCTPRWATTALELVCGVFPRLTCGACMRGTRF
jgi:hypothetical protein